MLSIVTHPTKFGLNHWFSEQFPIGTIFLQPIYTHPQGGNRDGYWQQELSTIYMLVQAGHQVILKTKYTENHDNPNDPGQLDDFVQGVREIAARVSGWPKSDPLLRQ